MAKKKKYQYRIKMELGKQKTPIAVQTGIVKWIQCPHCKKLVFMVDPAFMPTLAKWKKQPKIKK